MKIYLDLTFILNFLLCMVIFMLNDLVFSVKVPLIRKVIASLVGSTFSILLIVYPNLFSGLIPKLIFFLLICLSAFGFGAMGIFIKKSVCLFTISFIGAGTLIWITMERDGVVTFVNPVFDIKNLPKFLIFFLGIVIFIPLTRVFILNVKSLFNNVEFLYGIEIFLNGRKVSIKGFMDTGNSLYDPVSKLPVIIANKEKLKDLLGHEWENWFNKSDLWNIPTETKVKVSFIPFRSMGGEEVLLAFKPDKVSLVSTDHKRDADCLIGLNIKSTRMHPGVDALIHPSIVS